MTSKKLSKDVIDRWPEVFEGIQLNVVPLKYLNSIQIIFKNEKVWDIDVTSKRSEMTWQDVEKNIHQLFAEYQDEIENVDFKLDTEKLKSDIIRSTSRFLKKRKL
jgi:gas vesicle protein